MRVTDTHVYFWGSFLSNFYLTKIGSTKDMCIQNQTFNCSEQVYMIEKAAFFGDFASVEKMLKCEDGASVKALGRKVKNFDVEAWDKVSYEKMLIACRAKFFQNNLLSLQLCRTESKKIVEASPTDLIWGVGLYEDDDRILDDKNWTGENRLGKVLMQVREELWDIEFLF